MNGSRGQVTSFPLSRQFLAALFFTLGLCTSGRHRHPDTVNRSRCCNGFRISRRWHSSNGELIPELELRPITPADPRFSWEAEPPMMLELHASTNRHFSKRSTPRPVEKPFGPPPNEVYFYDGMPRLSLIDAHVAGGGVK